MMSPWSSGWGGVTLAHNVRSRDAVDAVIEEAREAGARIAREPGQTFWGGYSGVFVDPEATPGRSRTTPTGRSPRTALSSSEGYSGTPLARKLGITEGRAFAVVADPGAVDTLLAPLPVGARRIGEPEEAEVVLVFTTSRDDLASRIATLGEAIFPDGSLWVAWPKRASKMPTDMTEDVVREVALPLGLVDTKVAAIDATWSGLRLVWRRERRGD
jgi:hypothetical protein